MEWTARRSNRRVGLVALVIGLGLASAGGAGAATAQPVPTSPLAVATRVSWSAGDSTTMGAQLVPSATGALTRDGKLYDVEAVSGSTSSAGVGFEQLTIVSNDSAVVVADQRFFLITDVNTNTAVPSSAGVVTGSSTALGEYWIAPQLLAAMQDGANGGVTTSRGPALVGTETYNGITIATSTANTFTSYTYDVLTGLLLRSQILVASDDVPLAAAAGISRAAAPTPPPPPGTVSISFKEFLGTRQLVMPWASEPLPPWARIGTVTTYEGTFGFDFAGTDLGSAPTIPIRYQVTLDQPLANGFSGRGQSATFAGGVATDESTSNVVVTAAAFDGLWLPPATLAGFQPGQELDNDPVTSQRTWFRSVVGTTGVVVSTSPNDETENSYDLATGILLSSRRSETNPGVGVQVIEITLTGQTAGP